MIVLSKQNVSRGGQYNPRLNPIFIGGGGHSSVKSKEGGIKNA